MEILPGVCAFIRNEDREVLLVKRADTREWALPTGTVEPEETVKNALKREMKEEVNLEVSVSRLIGVYSDPDTQIYEYPDGATVHFVTHFFECQVRAGSVEPDEKEVLRASYYSLDELPENIMKMHPDWLDDALGEQNEAYVK